MEQQVHLEQLVALVDAAAEARSQVQEELGADGGEPGVDEAEMEAGDDRGEGAGQPDVAQELQATEGEDARDLPILAGDAAGAFRAVEDDGVERRQGDEGDLRLLAGTEPQGDQRHPGEQRDLPVGGEGGAEHALDEPGQAESQADGDADEGGDDESRDVAGETHGDVERQLPVDDFRQAPRSHGLDRRQEPRVADAGMSGEFPREKQDDRQGNGAPARRADGWREGERGHGHDATCQRWSRRSMDPSPQLNSRPIAPTAIIAMITRSSWNSWRPQAMR